MNIADVVEFMNKTQPNLGLDEFPVKLDRRVVEDRVACMVEELNEFKAAAEDGDIAKMADGLVDLVYFALGTAAMMGLTDHTWNQIWSAVHKANMTKIPGPAEKGAYKNGVQKPADFMPPDAEISDIIINAQLIGERSGEIIEDEIFTYFAISDSEAKDCWKKGD